MMAEDREDIPVHFIAMSTADDEIQLGDINSMAKDTSTLVVREAPPGMPISVEPISSIDQLPGLDHVHILHQVTEPPIRPMYMSALVLQIKEGLVKVISNSERGITKWIAPFASLKNLYKVTYHGQCSNEALELALSRLNMKENHYHPLNNNSHMFATGCKTGREYPMTDILRSLQEKKEETVIQSKSIIFKTPLTKESFADLQPGDHVMVDMEYYVFHYPKEFPEIPAITQRDFNLPISKTKLIHFNLLRPGDYIIKIDFAEHHHYLVTSTDSNSFCNVVESWNKCIHSERLTLTSPNKYPLFYRINYKGGSCIPCEESIQKAESLIGNERLLCKPNNFVHFLKVKEFNQSCSIQVEDLPDSNDYLKHYLIISTTDDANVEKCFSAYTTDTTGKVIIIEDQKWKPGMFKVTCSHQASLDSDTVQKECLSIANESFKKKWSLGDTTWSSSLSFITAVKCHEIHSVYEEFILDDDVKPTDSSTLSQYSPANAGDHLVIRYTDNTCHSVLVLDSNDITRTLVTPPLRDATVIDLTKFPEVYRIHYNQSLPSSEVLARAKSQKGNEIVKQSTKDLITWAKIGRKFISISTEDLIPKLLYEQISSMDDIQVADHLIQDQEHFIVTEIGSNFKVVTCSHGLIKEVDKVFDINEKIFRVVYPTTVTIEPQAVILKVKSKVNTHAYDPWAQLHLIREVKMGVKETIKGEFFPVPVSKSKIMCFTQLNEGDYLVKDGMIPRHCIVLSIESPTKCSVIESWNKTVLASDLSLAIPPKCPHYRINYRPGQCTVAKDSIKEARNLIGNSHRLSSELRAKESFIHYLKTKSLIGTCININDLIDDHQPSKKTTNFANLKSMPVLGLPQSLIPTVSFAEINVGDHIVYRANQPPLPPSYCSAIVTQVDKGPENKIHIITNKVEGVVEETHTFDMHSLLELKKVSYLSCPFSEAEAVKRAIKRLRRGEKSYHEDFNNSHFFVTWCKTGQEYPIKDLLVAKIPKLELEPVLYKSPINSLSDLKPGDHYVQDSQHYLIVSTNRLSKTFTAYTVTNNQLEQTKFVFNSNEKSFCVRYDHSCISTPEQTLQAAKKDYHRQSNWKRSDQFITMMKCGCEHTVNERSLISDSVDIVSCTPITQYTSVDRGDHLIIRQSETTSFHSVLVCACIGESSVVAIPPLNNKPTSSSAIDHEIISLRDSKDVYRINYNETLPSEQTLKRAESKEGEQILRESGSDHSCFISWTKTGKKLPLSDSRIDEILLNQTVAQIRPTHYEKIMSPDEILIGDHLFTNETITLLDCCDFDYYRHHFLVTEKRVDDDPRQFRVIYYLNGQVAEEVKELNPIFGKKSTSIYRIIYKETLPNDIAVERARRYAFRTFYDPWARMKFVRWAKTGSKEGLEVDFLINTSAPTTKSTISCFTQLKEGDYLVKEPSIGYYHHYLVVSVESPVKCTVIESWHRTVTESSIEWEDGPCYYRINYEPGACLPAELTVNKAKALIGKTFYKYNSEYARESFVTSLKTGESLTIDTDSLINDRILLQRERVTSALELTYGDHIERPLSMLTKYHSAQHHMLVVEPIDDRHCKVIHFKVAKSFSRVITFRKGDEVEDVVDIFEEGNAYRINYCERTNPEVGILNVHGLTQCLTREVIKKKEYNIKDNNCEHLVMIVTIGIPMSIQVNVVLHQALVVFKGSARGLRGSVISQSTGHAPKHLLHAAKSGATLTAKAGAKGSTKVSQNSFVAGAESATSASVLGSVGGVALAVNLVVETPIIVRGTYKLRRQKKFEVITEEEYKRAVLEMAFTSANTIIGGTVGAIAGQAAIPVPIFGAVAGGILGNLVGQQLGKLGGKVFAFLVYKDPKKPTLPQIRYHQYISIQELKEERCNVQEITYKDMAENI